MYVCVCNGVTDKQIIKAADNGAMTLQDLSDELSSYLLWSLCKLR